MSPETLPLSRKKKIVFRLLAVTGSILFLCLGLELILRVYHGSMTSFDPLIRNSWERVRDETGHARYDSELGWLPKSEGAWPNGARFHMDSTGSRSHASVATTGEGSTLTLGDSVTFGDEVEDSETWPAQLQTLIGRPVRNGAVFAYGVDQAVLRGERLLEVHSPAQVILGVISHDISRAQYSYYYAWKPFFRLVEGELLLCNVPAPRDPAPQGALPGVRRALSYSHLANSILSRLAAGWWSPGGIAEEHENGVEVSARLIERLANSCRQNDVRFLLVTIGVPAHLGGNGNLVPLAERVRDSGLEVLDLAAPLEKLEAEQPETVAAFFVKGGHYSAIGNAWLATRIAERLQGR